MIEDEKTDDVVPSDFMAWVSQYKLPLIVAGLSVGTLVVVTVTRDKKHSKAKPALADGKKKKNTGKK